MIFTIKSKIISENPKTSLTAESKYIVHFYHLTSTKNKIRSCQCVIKELIDGKSKVLIESTVNCDSRDNYVKAIGRKLSLIKCYEKLRVNGFPVDSDWLDQMLIQLNQQVPNGMKLAKRVNLNHSPRKAKEDSCPKQ